MSRRGGTLDNCISNGAHRSQGTPAHGPRTQSYNPLQNPEQLHSLVKLELGRRQAEGGRPSLGVLSARLPYKANETLSTPMFVVCDCWRRCRLCCAWPHGRLRQLLGPTHLSTEKQTNRQTDRRCNNKLNLQ